MKLKNSNVWLILAGISAFLGGLLHIVAFIGGPEWIAFLGAPDWAVESARHGTWIAPIGGMIITGLMWLCSTYAFSGAGLLPKVPLLRTGLFSIASVCILRGVVIIPFVISNPALVIPRATFNIVASLIWLATGLTFALGLHGLFVAPARFTVQRTKNNFLLWSGIATMLGGLVHIAVIFGGPTWYSFIGAPDGIAQMARLDLLYPVVACLVIAAFLFLCSSYAFSAIGLIRRLPFLRTGLTLIAIGLILRGIGFIPLMIYRPRAFVGICNCKGVDTLLIITSAICLATGIAYAVGAQKSWKRLNSQ